MAQSQVAIESQPNQPFAVYAYPTEQAVGLTFAHTAVLAQQPHNVPLLQQLGAAYGRLMYLFDSYKDFEADAQQGKFNALRETNDVHTYTAVAQTFWQETQQSLSDTVHKLNGKERLLSTVLLTKQLNRLGQKILNVSNGCTRCVTAGTSPNLEEKRKQQNCDSCVECSCCSCETCCYCDDCCCDAGCDCCL